MRATNISTRFKIKNKGTINKNFRTNWESKIISKWPAKMFAHIRTPRVIGRIVLLTISIRNKKTERIRGEPSGMQCLKNPFRLDKIFMKKHKSQILREKKNTKEGREVKGKLKDKTELKLIKIIIKNNKNINVNKNSL